MDMKTQAQIDAYKAHHGGELVAHFTAKGNRDPYTKKSLPGTLEITRHIPNVLTSHTIERVSLVCVVGKRDARKVAEMAGAKCWNF